MLKRILSVLLAIVFLVVAFYFWGSSGSMSEDDYTKITTYDTKSGQAPDTLTAITYNIGYLSGMTNNLAVEHSEDLYTKNLKDAINLFSTLKPDIVGFQEIDFNSSRSFNVDQLKEISQACGFEHAAMAVNWDKKYVPFPYGLPNVHFGKILSGQAISSKHTITENKSNKLEKVASNPFYYNAFYLDRLAQIAKIEINGKVVIVINVHLEAFVTETRENQARALLEMYRGYAKDFPVLLIGDFNSRPPYASEPTENDKTIGLFFEEASLRSAIGEATYLANESDFFTFDSGNPIEKIDFIFYNFDKIKPVSARVVKEAGEISDHLPVMFKFVIR